MKGGESMTLAKLITALLTCTMMTSAAVEIDRSEEIANSTYYIAEEADPDFLNSEESFSAEEIEDVIQTKPFGQVINTGSNLLIRENPSLDSKYYYAIYYGTTFDIIEKYNQDYYLIKHNTTVGYVRSEYVDEYDNTPNYPLYVNKSSSQVPSRGNQTSYEIKVQLTAYCSCYSCCGKTNGITASGAKATTGTIAAPSALAFGTKVYIPSLTNYKSDGIFTVQDRGGAIKIASDGSYIIDVWFPSHSEALKFGRKYTSMYIQ